MNIDPKFWSQGPAPVLDQQVGHLQNIWKEIGLSAYEI